jgi:Pyruvate/2-oxoacid:ferredoxin oxidoreductase delta subunit
MKIELRYFTGTGNSWKILDTCKDVFNENSHTVSISPITNNKQLPFDVDLIGFCFPVYAFGIPRICRRYLKQLQQFSKPQNVFVIITAGKQDESGFSVNECVKILRKKNCQIIYTAVVEMPINWITYLNPPSKDEALAIIEKGIRQSTEISDDILKGTHKYHRFNIPENYGRFGLYKEYYLFKYVGLQNMWRTFNVYDSCNGCELCAKICPTASIAMVNKNPRWLSSCEQCMRCVNYCPKQAIYQSMGGETAGRNRYYIPDFKTFNHNES